MKKTRKRVWLKVLAALILLMLAILGGLILDATLHDYNPPEKSVAEQIFGDVEGELTDTLSLVSWNLGYGGLGSEMDFFYDGGTRVRPERDYFEASQEEIMNYIDGLGGADIILLQEVDKPSKRSYYTDQPEAIHRQMEGYHAVFAANYLVKFVPVPLRNPMGKVSSGLLTLGKVPPTAAERISLPGNFGWPTRLFMLDRCLLVTRYPYHGGKEMVVINLHNSAFDTTGEIRRQEISRLKTILEEEYQKGNYIVAGGDWNMNPPGFVPEVLSGDTVFTIANGIEPDFMAEGWQWVYDPAVPTNRDVSVSYTQGQTGTTIIDFFLLSPNLHVVEIKTDHLCFKASDHHPVSIKISPLEH